METRCTDLQTALTQLFVVALRVLQDARRDLTQRNCDLVRRMAGHRRNQLNNCALLLEVGGWRQTRDNVRAQQFGEMLRLRVRQELCQGRDSPFPDGWSGVREHRCEYLYGLDFQADQVSGEAADQDRQDRKCLNEGLWWCARLGM